MSFISVTRKANPPVPMVVNTDHIRAVTEKEDGTAGIVMPSSGAFGWTIDTVETYASVVDRLNAATS